MNYFSVELCKKLQEKGLAANFWHYLHPESDRDFVEVAGFISDDGCSIQDYPMFIFQDLLPRPSHQRQCGEVISSNWKRGNV